MSVVGVMPEFWEGRYVLWMTAHEIAFQLDASAWDDIMPDRQQRQRVTSFLAHKPRGLELGKQQ